MGIVPRLPCSWEMGKSQNAPSLELWIQPSMVFPFRRQDGFSDFEAETEACLEPGTGEFAMPQEISHVISCFTQVRVEEKLLPAPRNLKRASGPSGGSTHISQSGTCFVGM